MPGPYDVGDTVTLEVKLNDPDTKAPVDANDIICHVQPPGGGGVATPTTSQFVSGTYRARYPITAAGEHWFQFASASLGMQREGAFVARPSRVT